MSSFCSEHNQASTQALYLPPPAPCTLRPHPLTQHPSSPILSLAPLSGSGASSGCSTAAVSDAVDLECDRAASFGFQERVSLVGYLPPQSVVSTMAAQCQTVGEMSEFIKAKL